MPLPYILPLDSPDATLANAGGKGLNLSRLVRAGFRVPPGIIVTTASYHSFVTANDLASISAGSGAAADVETQTHAAAEIRAQFESGRLPPPVHDALAAGYADLCARTRLPELAVAVRSSATAEDLPRLSFAGQQDTYLNVTGAAALFAAVRKCWAGLWNDRAVRYRAEHDIAPGTVALAVVVQALVNAEISGVLFTANPVTGNRNEMVIEATRGLGEGLVSGLVDPDSYTVDGERWKISDRFIGEKGVAIVPRAEGGTVRIHPPDASKPALSDEQVLALARLGAQIAAHFGAPQDIEWAMAHDEIFILQARPITTLD